MGILAVFAQFEREQIRERTMIGKSSRAQDGLWHGSKYVPIGYDYTDGQLIPNEYEAMQVNEIADMFLDNTPVRTIANIVTAKGYKTKYGEWDAKTIRRVIVNPVNIGMIKHRDKFYQGAHDPIMSKEKFEKVNALMEKRKEKYGTAYKPFSSLLGGMIYCKHCGGKYARQGNGGGIYYYSCYSRNKSQKKMIKDPNCKNKNYRMLDLDYVIIEAITRLSLEPEYIDKVRENKPKNDVSGKIKTINSEIEKIEAQISNMMDLYALGNMPLDVINQKVTALNTTKTALEKELDSLNVPDADEHGMTNEQIQNLADLINDKDLTLEEKREIVKSLIYYIEIDNEDIYVHWKF